MSVVVKPPPTPFKEEKKCLCEQGLTKRKQIAGGASTHGHWTTDVYGRLKSMIWIVYEYYILICAKSHVFIPSTSEEYSMILN